MVVCACLFAVCGLLIVVFSTTTRSQVIGCVQVLVGVGLVVTNLREGRRRPEGHDDAGVSPPARPAAPAGD
jgi:uncharacterized membrane protein HdeD (DUF308 family)